MRKGELSWHCQESVTLSATSNSGFTSSRLNLFALLRVNSSKWRPVLSQPLATAHIDSTVGTQRKNELEEDEGPRIYCGGRGQCLGNLNDAARMRQTT